jgi:hypothetical protein
VNQAEVEVKAERRSGSFFLNLDLSLNLLEIWQDISPACGEIVRRSCAPRPWLNHQRALYFIIMVCLIALIRSEY